MSLLNQCLANSSKLLHVGANTGQEAQLYDQLGLVVWHVEPVPEIYAKLKENIASYANQIAINHCLSSSIGEMISFHVANNEGQSSSMFELGRHRSAYPMVDYMHTLKLKTTTIDDLIERNIVDSDIDFLLIDAQGAELKILQGASRLLSSGFIKYVLVEVGIRPLYDGSASFVDVLTYLERHDLFLRDASFNDQGWANALFQTRYWPIASPADSLGDRGVNIERNASVELSSSCVIPAPLRIQGGPTGTFFFHSSLESRPWIKLSFPDFVNVGEILVFNRCDAARERAYDLNVYASMDGEQWDLIYENFAPFGGIDWPGPLSVKKDLRLRHIMLRLRGGNYFHLDHIMVFAQNTNA